MNLTHSIEITYKKYKSVEVCPVPFPHWIWYASYINGKALIFSLGPTAITNLGTKTSKPK